MATYSDDFMQRAVQMKDGGLTWDEVSDQLGGPSGEAVRKAVFRWRQENEPEAAGVLETDDGAVVTTQQVNGIRTVDEMIEFAQVDLDSWRIKDALVNAWTGATGDLHSQAKLWIQPREDEKRLRKLAEALIEDMRKHSPVYDLPLPPVEPDADNLLVMGIVDHHINLQASELMGDKYDIEIAKQLFIGAVVEILNSAKGYKLERILFPIGNDMGHIDTPNGTTTKGTPQDFNVPIREGFRHTVQTAAAGIELAATVAPVNVVMVGGNHDWMTTFYLGEVLAERFANHPRITVDNTFKHRQYAIYGNNLIGLVHGNEEKHGDLPLIMATEEPVGWARTKYRTWYTGHFHKRRSTESIAVDELRGVDIIQLPSLVAADDWHLSKGYMHRRAAQGRIHHRTFGPRAVLEVGVEQLLGTQQRAAA